MTFGTVVRHAMRRARAAQGIKPTQLARRMAALGYPWHPQTVSNVESGRRRVPADELLALGLALEVSVSSLLKPYEESVRRASPVQMPAGGMVLASAVASTVGNGSHQPWVLGWSEHDEPVWPSPETLTAIADLEQERRVVRQGLDKAVGDLVEAQLKGEQTAAQELTRRTDEAIARTARIDRFIVGLQQGRTLQELEAAEQTEKGDE